MATLKCRQRDPVNILLQSPGLSPAGGGEHLSCAWDLKGGGSQEDFLRESYLLGGGGARRDPRPALGYQA